MTDWNQIESILNEIKNEMGGDANEICTGECPDFAKTAVDRLSEIGVEAIIVDNLKEIAMKADLEGYDTIEAEYDSGISHCYLLIDGWYFDAFDTDGVEEEGEMTYHTAFN